MFNAARLAAVYLRGFRRSDHESESEPTNSGNKPARSGERMNSVWGTGAGGNGEGETKCGNGVGDGVGDGV